MASTTCGIKLVGPGRRQVLLAVSASLLVAVWPVVLRAESGRVAIVLTPHDTYRNAATAIEKALSDKGYGVQVFEMPKQAPKLVATRAPDAPASAPADPEINDVLKRVVEFKPAAIVTVGEAATLLTVEGTQKTPVVCSIVTNGFDLPMAVKGDPRAARTTGVMTDVDPKEQIAWIRRVQPQARSIGVLCSQHSKKTAEAIRRSGEAAGIKVSIVETTKEDFVKSVDAVTWQNCDGILMLADARIYDATAARHLLLWGVRNKKSVWAFSENFVKAGALGGCYADTDSMIQQAVTLVGKVIGGSNPAGIGLQYPNKVRRAVNERTAGLIGVTVPQDVLDSADARHGGSE
jgi:putative tryptophan/tyrosine transport system substrate-binding protein